MVVVLPAPFGPRNPTISPFPTVKDRSWMIVLAPYRFETDSRATTAGAALMTGGETARGGATAAPPGDTAETTAYLYQRPPFSAYWSWSWAMKISPSSRSRTAFSLLMEL